MGLLQKSGYKILSTYQKEVDDFNKKPFETQQKVFSYLLANGRDTLYAYENRFKMVKSIDDFRKWVPVITYESLKPYVEKIIFSDRVNILWNKPITGFAMSSGTTQDKSKYIPITNESLRDSHFKCGKQMLSMYLNAYPKSDFFLGKTLVLGGSQQINSIGEGRYTADISAILIKNLPFWAKTRRTPEKIALIPDWEEKLNKLIDYSLKTDIRAMAGVPSWLLVLLKQLVERSGMQIKDIWPNIDVFFHGGVSFTPFENQYNRIFSGTNMHYWETYNASEGFFGIQYSKENKDMLLMLDNNIYYEFLPLDQVGEKYPKSLLLDEVEIGEKYALVITTNGGLWRYMIGDVIEFTSTKPYLIKITGRTKHFINAFGEELIVDNADKALNEACVQTNSILSDYTACPIYFSETQSGSHEWLIEFDILPSNIEEFTSILDRELKKQNSDYEAKRSYDLSLQMPMVRIIPKGTFYNWMKSRNKLGGQNKIPRLSNDREYVDSICEFVRNQIIKN